MGVAPVAFTDREGPHWLRRSKKSRSWYAWVQVIRAHIGGRGLA
jgi:hypothetical protein